jgi:aerobic C4-dicarboxylate transport protein
MKPFWKTLYFWVLIAIILGAGFGVFEPNTAQTLSPVAEGFVSVIKFLIGPLIFCSVSLGIAGSEGKQTAGRIALKALVYFELVSTFALAIGLIIGNVLKPGVGFPIVTGALDASAVQKYVHPHGNLLNPLNGINLIQILLIGVLFGFGLHFVSTARREWFISRLKKGNDLLFLGISKLMNFAPVAAGCAMAFTVGKFGLDALRPLIFLMGCFYATCLIFIFGILGLVARLCGFRIWDFLKFLRAEILLVLGTSSSESALAPLMKKLEEAGCSKSVVGLVVPTGYSFNLDGTNIYLTLACLFIAQAFGVPLSLSQQLGILFFAMISSKGASGVTGAGFITLAATLSVVPEIPLVGLTLILGIDRFMSEARALTNMIGNGVATLVIARWEGALDQERLTIAMRTGGVPE